MSAHLLITKEGARAFRAARLMGAAATAEQLEQFAARAAALAPSGAPRIMQTVDGVAEIRVAGVLTESPDFFATYFGGGNTTYADIRTALRMAAADPAIREVVLSVDSPGGTVAGLFETLDVLEAFTKPLRAIASMACSAAYALVAQCDSIQAATSASFFGSIGVAVQVYVDDSVVDITNAASPEKRPDVTTPEGVAVVQRELDGIFELFASAIARGRGVSVERVTKDFGIGSTLLSAAAKQAGMIDALAATPNQPGAARSAPTETLAELLATRLPEEDAETYIRRCGALLERTVAPAVVAAPRSSETMVQALERVSGEMPAAFDGGPPAAAEQLAQAVQALASGHDPMGEVTMGELTAAIQAQERQQATATRRPSAEARPERQGLGEAVERAASLDWSSE